MACVNALTFGVKSEENFFFLEKRIFLRDVFLEKRIFLTGDVFL